MRPARAVVEGAGVGEQFLSQEIAKVPVSAAKVSVWKISGSKQGSRGGERSLGPKMLVPGFPDLGCPARGGGVVRTHGSMLWGRDPGSEYC